MKKWSHSILLLLLLAACNGRQPTVQQPGDKFTLTSALTSKANQVYTLPFPQDIKMKNYFKTVDSIVAYYNHEKGYNLTEHILINANPRIIDTLASFDYYLKMKDSIFIYDQKELIVFHKGDSMLIPDSLQAKEIEEALSNVTINVNIPEFRLRIFEGDDILYTFPVRVGANGKKYLETAGRIVDLETKTGEGEIVRLERDPWYVNPATGKRYHSTLRDDGKYTMMPQIPWMEPAINGIRHGELIHPTTNPETLGKPYSHGCIGLNESDAWRVYYCARLGTKVIFRYDLKVVNENGDTILLKDIYKESKDGHDL